MRYLDLTADVCPAVRRVAEDAVARAAGMFGVDQPEVRWFAPDEGYSRALAFEDDGPLWGRAVPAERRIWLNVELEDNPRELIATAHHEVAHIAGVRSEDVADLVAVRMEEDANPWAEILRSVTPETARSAAAIAEMEKERRERESKEAIRNLAFACRRARREATTLGERHTWELRRFGSSKCADQMWAARRRAKTLTEQLAELCLHDEELIARVLGLVNPREIAAIPPFDQTPSGPPSLSPARPVTYVMDHRKLLDG